MTHPPSNAYRLTNIKELQMEKPQCLNPIPSFGAVTILSLSAVHDRPTEGCQSVHCRGHEVEDLGIWLRFDGEWRSGVEWGIGDDAIGDDGYVHLLKGLTARRSMLMVKECCCIFKEGFSIFVLLRHSENMGGPSEPMLNLPTCWI